MSFEIGAGNETRTRDPDLGKVVLYQLSYSRLSLKERYFSDPSDDVNSILNIFYSEQGLTLNS